MSKWLAIVGGGYGDKVWDKEITIEANTFNEAYEHVKVIMLGEYDCGIFVLESDERMKTIKEEIRGDATKNIREALIKHDSVEEHIYSEWYSIYDDAMRTDAINLVDKRIGGKI